MAKTMQWSDAELALTTELAVGMARRLYAVLAHTNTSGRRKKKYMPEGYVWHMATSTFETACLALWRLGVAYGAVSRKEYGFTVDTVNDGRRPLQPIAWHKFFSEEDIRKKLAGPVPASAPEIEDFIAAYLDLVCNFGSTLESALSSGREVFTPQAEFGPAIDAFAELEYIEKTCAGVRWTDKIELTMQSVFLWDHPYDSSWTWKENQEECRLLLQLTPEETRAALSRCVNDKRYSILSSPLRFATALRDEFDGLYINRDPDGTPRHKRADMRLINAIQSALIKRDG